MKTNLPVTDNGRSIIDILHDNRDEKYREFQCRLMPGIKPESVIGVRTPVLRKIARDIDRSAQAAEFLEQLPHRYYDENNLHAFLIERIRDYDECISRIDRFLPYVDNWATCDSMSPKVLAKHTDELMTKIREWIHSDGVYTVRFGIEMLMSYYLDERFCPEYPELVAQIRSNEYYINMMIAWYFATALAKQYDTAVDFLVNRRLDTRTHNKAIQKAIESYRISDDRKIYLRSLKIR